jgi:hypothetical protein
MVALTYVTDASARAAYDCLGPGMRTSSEDQFVASLQQRSAGDGQANRVADRRTPDGGKIVFFTVSAGDTPSVGYIVYLDPNGKNQQGRVATNSIVAESEVKASPR